ncbi:MAG: pyridoxamine 5'-phosphate oxidase family protein, partial [Chloroflexi bacterium]|nr:pyridoxamine 5'-phosphate oxidase family protein [Chloroflexota bacterium]
MLDKLRDRALRIIAATPTCTLATTGPAGLQASAVSCRMHEGRVFVLIPATSDHLFNLEHHPEVVLTTPQWQLRGLVSADGAASSGAIGVEPHQSVIAVEVLPVRMHLEPAGDGGHRETIDFQPVPARDKS